MTHKKLFTCLCPLFSNSRSQLLDSLQLEVKISLRYRGPILVHGGYTMLSFLQLVFRPGSLKCVVLVRQIRGCSRPNVTKVRGAGGGGGLEGAKGACGWAQCLTNVHGFLGTCYGHVCLPKSRTAFLCGTTTPRSCAFDGRLSHEV